MTVLGIIAEFNPFHTGHAYFIEQAKKACHADYCVVVMSGDFVQRGEPAFFPKEMRCRLALLNGADLVLELPIAFSTGSAEYFARASVALLHKLGCITHLGFGSEQGNITLFQTAASCFSEESESYKALLAQYLKDGYSFPKARFMSYSKLLSDDSFHTKVPDTSLTDSLMQDQNAQELLALLQSPNAILGLEYCQALKELNSPIIPFCIQRQGAGYHDLLDEDETSKDQDTLHFASATGLRNSILQLEKENNLSHLQPLYAYIPQNCHTLFESSLTEKAFLCIDDFYPMLQYKILQSSAEELNQYQDVSVDLAEKLKALQYQCIGFSDLIQKCKSKNLTYTRISRALLHILLGITKESVAGQVELGYISYARILGFCKDASALLSEIKKSSDIPLLSKLKDAKAILSDVAFSQLSETMHSSDLYHTILSQKTGVVQPHEYGRSLTIL